MIGDISRSIRKFSKNFVGIFSQQDSINTDQRGAETCGTVYCALVVANEDPNKLGRLKVRLPSILGDAELWAVPSIPIGVEVNNLQDIVPETGAMVWIAFEGGDLTRPVWIGRVFTD